MATISAPNLASLMVILQKWQLSTPILRGSGLYEQDDNVEKSKTATTDLTVECVCFHFLTLLFQVQNKGSLMHQHRGKSIHPLQESNMH
jgi:hypothetical protein